MYKEVSWQDAVKGLLMFVLVVSLPLTVILISFTIYNSSLPVPVKLSQNIMGFKVVDLSNGTYVFPFTVKNPFPDSAQVFYALITSPLTLSQYSVLSCSLRNGSTLQREQTVNVKFTIKILENYGNESEYHVKIWCKET